MFRTEPPSSLAFACRERGSAAGKLCAPGPRARRGPRRIGNSYGTLLGEPGPRADKRRGKRVEREGGAGLSEGGEIEGIPLAARLRQVHFEHGGQPGTAIFW